MATFEECPYGWSILFSGSYETCYHNKKLGITLHVHRGDNYGVTLRRGDLVREIITKTMLEAVETGNLLREVFEP